MNSLIAQITYLKDYNLFLINKYIDEQKGEIRFNKLTTEVVKDIFTKDNIAIASAQVNTRNWAKVKETLEPLEIVKSKKVPDEEWIKSHHLPEELLKNPKMLAFVRDTKLYSHMQFYKHSLQTESSEGLSLLVDGKRISMEEVLNQFSLQKDGNEFYIIKNETGKRYYYLEEGLVEYDPQRDIKPLRSLTPEETPEEYTVIFHGIKEGHTNSAGGVKRWDRHTFIGLKTPDGKYYSFGAISKGGVTCPDPYSYIPKKRVDVEFTITKEDFDGVLEMVSEEQLENRNFNILFRNCSSLGGRVAQKLNIPASPLTKIEENNTLEHRVKAFAFSKEISKELKKQASKEGSTGEIEEKILAKIPELIQTNENLGGMQKMILFSAFLSRERAIRSAIHAIVQDVKKDSELTLTEKLFNLACDIFNATKEMEICHPNVFFNELEVERDSRLRELEDPMPVMII